MVWMRVLSKTKEMLDDMHKRNITLQCEGVELSCDAIYKCDNKLSLYHFLRKQLGNQRGRCVYTALNEDFLQWKMEMVG